MEKMFPTLRTRANTLFRQGMRNRMEGAEVEGGVMSSKLRLTTPETGILPYVKCGKEV